MSPAKNTQKPSKSTKSAQKSRGLTAEERAAMKETLRERKGEGEGESAVLAKIAAMAAPDRALAKRVHAIVKASAPQLLPKTWYGMPAYANEAGKVVCFFQDAAKFKARYATFGFSDTANLDDGAMWPTSYALMTMTASEEAKIAALVRKAAG